ncbi:MAG: anaerobic ribonucleoside-triphosphate reductase activating protein [Muribaculaceae bacterium]|nr:anaerobic ribonucleoside-triphosphate reductase activating protein [Muribaculaceae bacterium]
MEPETLRVLDIIPGTSVDGPGLRTSIYFAGCSHHCPGCHNPQSWDRSGGRAMTVEEIMAIVEENGFNITLSGGDPLEQPCSQLLRLIRAAHEAGYTVWCYTGYRYEAAVTDPEMKAVIEELDALVDGPFIESMRDTSLRFRGSANQRIIDPAASSLDYPAIITLYS